MKNTDDRDMGYADPIIGDPAVGSGRPLSGGRSADAER